MFNCREIKTERDVNQQTLDILALNGCGSLGQGFYLCPTISIAMSLLSNYQCVVYHANVWSQLVDYISRTLPNPNTWLITPSVSNRTTQTQINYKVKLLLAEAEAMWMNFWSKSRNQ